MIYKNQFVIDWEIKIMLSEEQINSMYAAVDEIDNFLDTHELLYKEGSAIAQGRDALEQFASRETECEQPRDVFIGYDVEDHYSCVLNFSCPKCGKNFDSNGFEYCPYCGQKLPTRIMGSNVKGFYDFSCDAKHKKYIDEDKKYHIRLENTSSLDGKVRE